MRPLTRRSSVLALALLAAVPLAGVAATVDLAGAVRATPYPSMGALEIGAENGVPVAEPPAAVVGLVLKITVN